MNLLRAFRALDSRKPEYPSEQQNDDHKRAMLPLRDCTDESQGIRRLSYADLTYTSEKQRRAFLSYVKMVNIAWHHGCTRILELGAGLSTAVWSQLAARTRARVTSVDLDFTRMWEYVAGSRYADIVTQHVHTVTGATVTASELAAFYQASPMGSYAGVPSERIVPQLRGFYRDHWRREEIETALGLSPRQLSEMCIVGEPIFFPPKLLDLFSGSGEFLQDVGDFHNATGNGKDGVLNELIESGETWDMVFFDCGEFSSMIEWAKIKDRIDVDGLVAFHDVFFPKSFKNFVACASVLADPDWELVFLDDSNSQGLMIAHRLR